MKSEEFEKIWNEEKSGKDILDRVFAILRQTDLNIYDCELEVTHAKKIKYMTKTFIRIHPKDGKEQEVLERFKLYFNKNNEIFYIRYAPTVTYGYEPIMSLPEFFKAMYLKKGLDTRRMLSEHIESCIRSVYEKELIKRTNLAFSKAYYDQYNCLCFDIVGGCHNNESDSKYNWCKYFDALSAFHYSLSEYNNDPNWKFTVDTMEYNPLADEFCCTYVVEGFGDKE